MIAREIIFEGRVQGVGFRYTARELAKGFDVTGEVKNLPDRSVRMLLVGEQDEVDDYLRELVEESAMAHHIKEVSTKDLTKVPETSGFRILR